MGIVFLLDLDHNGLIALVACACIRMQHSMDQSVDRGSLAVYLGVLALSVCPGIAHHQEQHCLATS